MGIRILLVEDVRQSHELIVELLMLVGGFDLVGTCATESTALQWLHDHPGGADLVVLDLMLREGSGFSVLQHLSCAGMRGAPDAVVFSDFASPAVVGKCRSQGALDAIPKADYRRLRVFLERYRGGEAERSQLAEVA